MALLQLACDMVDTKGLLELIPRIRPYIDIFEMGTPYCLRYGVKGMTDLLDVYPDLNILADIKIFDGGGIETGMYTESGAKYITVMSRTNDATIKACTQAAHETGGLVMADLMCEMDLDKRVPELEALGVDVLAVHVAYDDYMKTGLTPLKSLQKLSSVVKTAKTAVAGGIKLENIDDYLECGPDIVIVGGGIFNAEDPVATAKSFYEAVHR